MPETPPIKIAIICDTEDKTIKCYACLSNYLQKNWVSRNLVDRFGLSLEATEFPLTENWSYRELRSIGTVDFSWYRRDVVSGSNIYRATFYVTSDDLIPVVIGHELLVEEPGISNPKDSVLPLVAESKSKSMLTFLGLVLRHRIDIGIRTDSIVLSRATGECREEEARAEGKL